MCFYKNFSLWRIVKIYEKMYLLRYELYKSIVISVFRKVESHKLQRSTRERDKDLSTRLVHWQGNTVRKGSPFGVGSVSTVAQREGTGTLDTDPKRSSLRLLLFDFPVSVGEKFWLWRFTSKHPMKGLLQFPG